MELPVRKPQRLKDFDYSQNNAYFVTICTQYKLSLFGEIINNSAVLNNAGKMVSEKIQSISYDNGITVEKYVAMPNHVHMVITISHNGMTQGSFSTLSELVQCFKAITTKLYIDGVKSRKYPHFENRCGKNSFMIISFVMKKAFRKSGNTLTKTH